MRRTLPELPAARTQRFQQDHGLSAYDAAQVSATRGDADAFEALVAAGVPAKVAANWMSGDVAALANEHHLSLAESGLGVGGLARLLNLLVEGVINGPTAKELLAEIYVAGGDADALVRSRGLAQVSDTAELTALVEEAIRDNAGAAADFQGGKDAALGRLVGAVMKATRGKAQPQLVDRLLRERLRP